MVSARRPAVCPPAGYRTHLIRLAKLSSLAKAGLRVPPPRVRAGRPAAGRLRVLPGRSAGLPGLSWVPIRPADRGGQATEISAKLRGRAHWHCNMKAAAAGRYLHTTFQLRSSTAASEPGLRRLRLGP